jgi:hypothetical protein
MSKQIKLGFDKGIPRPTKADQVLVDVRGNLLRDSTGNFLYTETEGTAQEFFRADKATSVHINNEPAATVSSGKSIPVIEQFPTQSEVSLTLLGIPRLGKQQSLFSDVSVYGIDDNTWEFYRNPTGGQPTEWANRRNKSYGNRYEARLTEYANEQTLAIEAFPTPWSFPSGPRFTGRGYNPTLFLRYRRFITLGNALYDYYSSRNLEVFARNRFLIPDMATDDGEDVIYNGDFSLALQYVEQWTISWMDIRDNRLDDPLNPGRKLNVARINSIFEAELGFSFGQTQPGYSSTGYRYCQLQSKESFRYQPGAISGFTFGVRLNSDPTTLSTAMEWGCANDTDQFMFQVKGSRFSIVRRSTVPLTPRNLELIGFRQEDQKQVQSPNPFERGDSAFLSTDIGIQPLPRGILWELEIPSEKFNGDPLDGSGRSQYNISFNEVTMYKIEYSWYGAIGARFYAYIPVGNDEARWVLLHTFVIENTLDSPSMQNPFLHFRYSFYMNDTSSLREPIYLYKYGASYYIDGSDDGTYSYNSYKIPGEKNITSAHSVPLMGFSLKNAISNRDNIATENQKNFYVEQMSVASDKNIRVDILECEGCPGGHGHFYATSLRNGQKGLVDQFRINQQGELVFVDPEKTFTADDDNKKIIAPGVFSSYIFQKPDDDQARLIRRRLGTSRINVPIDDVTYETGDTAIVSGQPISLIDYQFTGRLTGYDDLIASTVPLVKSNISVQFLNPTATETTGQWAEFRIGITPKRPALSIPSGETEEVLLFDGQDLDIETEVYGEFTQFGVGQNLQGFETGEGDGRYGQTMQQDPRVPRPRGSSSGACSELNFEILTTPVIGVSYSNTDVSGTLSGDHFLVFESAPPLFTLNGGDIGIFDGNQYVKSNITFSSNVVTVTDEETQSQIFVVAISDDITQVTDVSQTGIALKTVRCFGRYINKTRITAFGANEYYLFIAMRDNARVNNIVVKEFDSTSSFSHTPAWIKDGSSNIEILQVENPTPSSAVIDKLPTSNEYIGTDGRFYMGGVTFTGNIPANFEEKNRLDSVRFDDQLSLPLRPASLKTSVFVGANNTETINMTHIFGADRYKMTKGAYNTASLYFSAVVTEPGETGTIQINLSGKEQ